MQRPTAPRPRNNDRSARTITVAVISALLLLTTGATPSPVDQGSWCDVFPQWPGCTNQ